MRGGQCPVQVRTAPCPGLGRSALASCVGIQMATALRGMARRETWAASVPRPLGRRRPPACPTLLSARLPAHCGATFSTPPAPLHPPPQRYWQSCCPPARPRAATPHGRTPACAPRRATLYPTYLTHPALLARAAVQDPVQGAQPGHGHHTRHAPRGGGGLQHSTAAGRAYGWLRGAGGGRAAAGVPHPTISPHPFWAQGSPFLLALSRPPPRRQGLRCFHQPPALPPSHSQTLALSSPPHTPKGRQGLRCLQLKLPSVLVTPTLPEHPHPSWHSPDPQRPPRAMTSSTPSARRTAASRWCSRPPPQRRPRRPPRDAAVVDARASAVPRVCCPARAPRLPFARSSGDGLLAWIAGRGKIVGAGARRRFCRWLPARRIVEVANRRIAC